MRGVSDESESSGKARREARYSWRIEGRIQSARGGEAGQANLAFTQRGIQTGAEGVAERPDSTSRGSSHFARRARRLPANQCPNSRELGAGPCEAECASRVA